MTTAMMTLMMPMARTPTKRERRKRRGGPGAKPIASSLWLEAEIARLPQDAAPIRLYIQWLEEYKKLRGYYPADARRSFRAARDGCFRRLARQRKG